MVAKQLSVFIENRQGRLGEVLKVLKNNNVNILSLSLADTTEYGLLRLIVNAPEKGKEELTKILKRSKRQYAKLFRNKHWEKFN